MRLRRGCTTQDGQRGMAACGRRLAVAEEGMTEPRHWLGFATVVHRALARSRGGHECGHLPTAWHQARITSAVLDRCPRTPALGAFSSCTFPGHRGRERRAIDKMGCLSEGHVTLCAKVIIQANLDRIGRQIITIPEIS